MDAGLNFIDTADVYSVWVPGNQGGESETILGKWFRRSGKREQIVLATKVAKHPQRKLDCPPATSGRPSRIRCAVCKPIT